MRSFIQAIRVLIEKLITPTGGAIGPNVMSADELGERIAISCGVNPASTPISRLTFDLLPGHVATVEMKIFVNKKAGDSIVREFEIRRFEEKQPNVEK